MTTHRRLIRRIRRYRYVDADPATIRDRLVRPTVVLVAREERKAA